MPRFIVRWWEFVHTIFLVDLISGIYVKGRGFSKIEIFGDCIMKEKGNWCLEIKGGSGDKNFERENGGGILQEFDL